MPIRTPGAVLAAVLLAGAACTPATLEPPSPPDVVHQTAELRLRPEAGTFEGHTTLRVRPGTEGGALTLRFAGDVTDAALDGRPLRPAISGDSLRFDVPAGRDVEIALWFEGVRGRGFQMDSTRAFTAFNTHGWLPVHWSLGDRATLDLRLVVPDGWSEVAVGRPDSTSGRVVWRLDEPFPAYLFGFAAGADLEMVERPMTPRAPVLAPGDLASAVPSLMTDLPDMVRFLEEVSGTAFPDSVYRQVFLPGAPAQEMATFTLLPAGYGHALAAEPSEDYLVIHELAHQWWGNRVTAADWSHFWLHEGVVTFLVAAWKERRWGRDAYDRELRLANERVARDRRDNGPRALVDPRHATAETAGGTVPYSLGLIVLDALRRDVGDDAFWNGLRAFTRDGLESRAVTTDDLQAAMERASARDLDAWFETWVHTIVPGGAG